MSCLFIFVIVFPKKSEWYWYMEAIEIKHVRYDLMVSSSHWKYLNLILSVMEIEHFFSAYNGNKLQLSEMIA